jgi:hypothetical protein
MRQPASHQIPAESASKMSTFKIDDPPNAVFGIVKRKNGSMRHLRKTYATRAEAEAVVAKKKPSDFTYEATIVLFPELLRQ